MAVRVADGGGTPLRVSGDNLGSADVDAFDCDVLHGDGTTHELQAAALVGTVDADDGAAGVGAVTCSTPAGMAAAEATVGVQLTRAGQTYSTHDDVATAPHPFAFYKPRSDESVVPMLGPARGDTLLVWALPPSVGGTASVANGSALRAAFDEARCKFGDVEVPATVNADADAARCVAPTAAAAGGAGGGVVNLQLALNGQDYEPTTPLAYRYYAHPRLESVFPVGAPFNTSVTFVGEGLEGAGAEPIEYTCRFGGEAQIAAGHDPQLVAGTLQPATRVVANVPPRQHGALQSAADADELVEGRAQRRDRPLAQRPAVHAGGGEVYVSGLSDVCVVRCNRIGASLSVSLHFCPLGTRLCARSLRACRVRSLRVGGGAL